MFCPQSEPRTEPLDTQCTSAQSQDLKEYQKTHVIKEEDHLHIVSNNPQDNQPLKDIQKNKENDMEHFSHNLLPDSTSPKDLRDDISSEVAKLSSGSELLAVLMPEKLIGQEGENAAAKNKISALPNKMEEANIRTSSELGVQSSSIHKPTDNPLLPIGEVEQKLTKSHRQIIEKIRSYYEAAEAVAEDGQISRRNSFSNIPAGLVKDSVSRFNFFVHQDSVCDSESGRSDSYENEITSASPILPEQNTKNFSQPNYTGVDAAVSHNSPGQSKTEPKSDDDKICDFKPCMELWKEKERKASGVHEKPKVSACNEGGFTDDEVCAKYQLSDRRIPVFNEQLESEKDKNESLEPKSPEQTHKTIKEAQTTAVPREKTYPNGSLEGLPSQIKVERWSRHGKAITCSTTLYEGIAEVSSLGFFETAPMDQCLAENSEKILSKVQMLAQMYMAKSSCMKVPLHQKRTRLTKGPCKVNIPLKSQILLHQAEVKTQNHLSGKTLFSCMISQTIHKCWDFNSELVFFFDRYSHGVCYTLCT